VDCGFEDNGWGGYYNSDSGKAALSFRGCSFGQQESNEWYFRTEEAEFIDCEFTEPNMYPDYSDVEEDYDYDYDYEHPPFLPDEMAPVTVGPELFENSSWTGYAIVDPESGETTELPYQNPVSGKEEEIFVTFSDDGTGTYTDWEGTRDFKWHCESADAYYAYLELPEQQTYYAGMYVMGEEYGYRLWMFLQSDSSFIWLY
jgi:hypothetical protein